ncbi:MAG: M20/M25/M40 family metallo-hydrolase [Ardenticatenaceae bacterium]|nr:M20/M25/M40 family metallo-hydrolase [Ardenticatenaceae bacterium]
MGHNVLQLTKELIAIPSVSHWSNAAVSNFIEDRLKRAGFEVERLEYTYKNDEVKVNLVAKKGTGTGGLAFLCHSDTVSGMEEEWEPFQPVVKDGRLYGRGSCDMKGPLAAVLAAVADVETAHLEKPLYVVVTADEEIGLFGARHVVRHSKVMQESRPTHGIVTEPTRLIPVYGHKGYWFIKVTAHGKAAHTSSGEGQSASFRLAPFLAEMAALSEQFQRDPSYMNDEFDPPTNGFNMVFADDGQPNMTSATASCSISLRTMPNARCQEIMDLITTKAEAYGFEVKAGLSPAVYTPTDSPLVQAACHATGNFQPETVAFGTEGFHYQKLMELVVLGPGDIAVAHTVGEYVPVAELEAAVDMYKRMIATICGPARD